jgi:hypothetical protein
VPKLKPSDAALLARLKKQLAKPCLSKPVRGNGRRKVFQDAQSMPIWSGLEANALLRQARLLCNGTMPFLSYANCPCSVLPWDCDSGARDEHPSNLRQTFWHMESSMFDLLAQIFYR